MLPNSAFSIYFLVAVVLYERYKASPKMIEEPNPHRPANLGEVVYLPINHLMQVSMKNGLMPSMAQVIDAYLQRIHAPDAPTVGNDQKMLLIDEVDVFFGESFYGKTQHAALDFL